MTKYITAVAVLLFASSVSAQVFIHPNYRVENYHDGSCVHAATATCLATVGATRTANYVLRNYWGGEWMSDLSPRLMRWGITTKETLKGNRSILDWAHSKKLPAVIKYHRQHACIFQGWAVDRNGIITHAYVLNNNDVSKLETPTYTAFMCNWLSQGGIAIVIVPRRAK